MKFRRLVFILLTPLIPLFLSQTISFNQKTLSILKPEINIMILVNYFLWLLLYGFCFSLFSKTYRSFSLYFLIFILFSLINNFKIKILYQPFNPSDFSQLKNFLIIFPNFIKQPKIFILLILVLIIFILFYKIFKKTITTTNQKILRIIIFPTSILIFLTPLIFTQRYITLLEKTEFVLYRVNPLESCQKNGILFCFFDDLKNIKIKSPENYSKNTIKKIYSEIAIQKEKIEPSTKPNVILILSEALFDVTKFSEVKFEQDPIENIRADVVSTLVSPQVNGGTANVEFEILTGLSNYFYNNIVPYSQFIRQDLPSLFTLFKEQGYQTTVIHPFLKSMYNRTSVYKHFGLDKFTSLENIPYYQKSGPYVSDKSFIDEILKQYNSTENPQFIFGMTMQNHYPFEPNRFPNHQVNFTDNLPTTEHLILQSYIEGIYLSDQSYQSLKETILKSTKPTIVIYFGDHLPSLISDYNIYQLVNYVTNDQENWTQQDYQKMYTTPIATFNNFSKSINFNQKLSPNFLSLEVLKAASIEPKYQFKFLQSISKKDTILKKDMISNLTEKQIQDYYLIQYDIISGKQYQLDF